MYQRSAIVRRLATRHVGRCLVTACLLLLSGASAFGQGPTDVYTGRTIHSLVGLSAGGGADTHMRLVARYLGKHLPGRPAVVPQNMTGANGLILANYLSNVAPRDGTTIGLLSSALLLQQAVSKPGIQYDLEKFNWLGSAAPRTVGIIVVSSAAGIDLIDQAKQREVVLGGIGVGGITSSLPKLINDLLGTRFKIVTGYPGSPQLDLAVERGEVHGRHYTWSGLKANQPRWIANKQVKVLLYAGDKPDDLDGVPSLELARRIQPTVCSSKWCVPAPSLASRSSPPLTFPRCASPRCGARSWPSPPIRISSVMVRRRASSSD